MKNTHTHARVILTDRFYTSTHVQTASSPSGYFFSSLLSPDFSPRLFPFIFRLLFHFSSASKEGKLEYHRKRRAEKESRKEETHQGRTRWGSTRKTSHGVRPAR